LLNPNDNQGLRIPLSSWLIIQQNWSELADLLALYADEISLPMFAAKALLLYAQEGDSAKAKKAKKQMHQSNKHAIKYLTGQKKPNILQSFISLAMLQRQKCMLLNMPNKHGEVCQERCFGCEKYKTTQCFSAVYFVRWPVHFTPPPLYFFI
jgi:hypothetical protein